MAVSHPCWKILGVYPTKDERLIRSAFKRGARKYHPDMAISDAERQSMHEKFITVQYACEHAPKLATDPAWLLDDEDDAVSNRRQSTTRSREPSSEPSYRAPTGKPPSTTSTKQREDSANPNHLTPDAETEANSAGLLAYIIGLFFISGGIYLNHSIVTKMGLSTSPTEQVIDFIAIGFGIWMVIAGFKYIRSS